MGIEQQIQALENQVISLRTSAENLIPGSEQMTIGEIAESLSNIDLSLSEYSWADLKRISDDKTITAERLKKYIGQRKIVNIAGYGDFEFMCSAVRRSNGAGFVFESINIIDIGQVYYGNAPYGWTSTDLYEKVSGEMTEALPSDLKAVIKGSMNCLSKENITSNGSNPFDYYVINQDNYDRLKRKKDNSYFSDWWLNDGYRKTTGITAYMASYVSDSGVIGEMRGDYEDKGIVVYFEI